MAKLYDENGSWEFQPGQNEPPTSTHGDTPTVESIAGKLEDITIAQARDKLADEPPAST